MAFDEILAERVRQHLSGRKKFSEKKMFGGICFLLQGNMCCGVLGDDLIVRVSPDKTDALLRRKHVRTFDFTGRPSKTMVYVGSAGLRKEADLKEWLDLTLRFVRSLPPKS